ncbi:hypothetical protein [Bacillus suaedae]|uniref:Uncharacterized protein n=1 Tax=Halalkalibacter suaedae TaxID=2822140 RepID=A0A941AT84_9BACI|nr:hypothetical protein [Bacillus suaedae]MBP3951149.1 hypothetical protein [Bacillus suaedae]
MCRLCQYDRCVDTKETPFGLIYVPCQVLSKQELEKLYEPRKQFLLNLFGMEVDDEYEPIAKSM